MSQSSETSVRHKKDAKTYLPRFTQKKRTLLNFQCLKMANDRITVCLFFFKCFTRSRSSLLLIISSQFYLFLLLVYYLNVSTILRLFTLKKTGGPPKISSSFSQWQILNRNNTRKAKRTVVRSARLNFQPRNLLKTKNKIFFFGSNFTAIGKSADDRGSKFWRIPLKSCNHIAVNFAVLSHWGTCQKSPENQYGISHAFAAIQLYRSSIIVVVQQFSI